MSQKNMYIGVAVALVAVTAFIMLGFFNLGGITPTTGEAPQNDAQALLDEISRTGTVAELRTVDTVVGTGQAAAAGQEVTVRYIGVLPDGTIFDQSADHGGSFSFMLGAGDVIQGWDLGVQGMKVGGTRLLAIPPSLGYGDRAIGAIPANSTLLFQVELVSVGAGE